MNDNKRHRGHTPVQDEPFVLLITIDVHQSSATRSSVMALRGGGGPPDRVNFNNGLKKAQLEVERDSCLALLNDAASRPWGQSFKQPPNDVRALQRRGRDLFDFVFANTDANYQAAARRKLLGWLRSNNLQSITVESSIRAFPVEALFFSDDCDGRDLDGFIGMRAPVRHHPEACLDAVYEEYDEEPSIGLLGHSEVASVAKRDASSVFAMLDSVKGLRVIEATPLKDTDNVTEMDVADMQALFRAFAKKRNVWHITSHMRDSGGVREFTLDNDLPISARDLRSGRAAVSYLVGQPLVFLSICDSGVPGVHAGNDLAASFTALDAGGVIATHSVVNVHFATSFAGRFYRFAFADLTIAESLYKARIDSVREDGNLAALTYFFEAHQDYRLPSVKHVEAEARHVG